MEYKELIEQLKYYGTTYAIGDNLGREIQGTDDLMLKSAEVIAELSGKIGELEKQLMKVNAEKELAIKDINSIITGDFTESICQFCIHDSDCKANNLEVEDPYEWCMNNVKWRGLISSCTKSKKL